jgi:16S rRNA (uracil1498-N3)-methyltransferase
MAGFSAARDAVKGGLVTLRGDSFHHAARVARVRAGDEISVLVEGGQRLRCRVTQILKDCLIAHIEESFLRATEPSVSVALYQSILKADKIELIIRKTVELGVSSVVPVVAERCVSRPEGTARLERWRKVSVSAACQSGRERVPEIAAPVSFDDALSAARTFQRAFLFSEVEREKSLRSALLEVSFVPSVALLLGPEGGFTEAEVERARSAGLEVVTLGPRILRAETAAIASAAVVLFALGQMD